MSMDAAILDVAKAGSADRFGMWGRQSAHHKRHNGGPAGMAVLVQPMVDLVAAGVASPSDQDRGVTSPVS
jgi:hypothetical protein